MHVRVEQSRYQKAAAGLDDLGPWPDAMPGTHTDKGYAAVCDGDICIGDDFTGLDANPSAFPDHEVGRLATHCDINQ
jgi:hypothetical protein